MKTPNLRDWQPTEGDAKHVDDTKMLSTTASETVDMNESNDTKEYTTKAMSPGTLGVTGRH